MILSVWGKYLKHDTISTSAGVGWSCLTFSTKVVTKNNVKYQVSNW